MLNYTHRELVNIGGSLLYDSRIRRDIPKGIEELYGTLLLLLSPEEREQCKLEVMTETPKPTNDAIRKELANRFTDFE